MIKIFKFFGSDYLKGSPCLVLRKVKKNTLFSSVWEILAKTVYDLLTLLFIFASDWSHLHSNFENVVEMQSEWY